MEKEVGQSPDTADDDKYVTALVKAYIFGDRFLAPGFQNATLDHFMDHINYCSGPTWFSATAYGFNNLAEESPMLEFLADMHCSFYEWNEADEENDKERCAIVPASFWFRVAMAYGRKAREEGLSGHGSHLDPCEYHGHTSEEERGACERKVVPE